MRQARPKENTVLRDAQKHIEWMRGKGVPIKCVKYHGNAFSKASTPDVHVTYDGRSGWIELKRLGEDADPGQKQELKQWASAGAFCAVCDSIESFERALRRFIDGDRYCVIWVDGTVQEFK